MDTQSTYLQWYAFWAIIFKRENCHMDTMKLTAKEENCQKLISEKPKMIHHKYLQCPVLACQQHCNFTTKGNVILSGKSTLSISWPPTLDPH